MPQDRVSPTPRSTPAAGRARPASSTLTSSTFTPSGKSAGVERGRAGEVQGVESTSVRQARCGLPIETARPANRCPASVGLPGAERPRRAHVHPVAAVGGRAHAPRAAAGADEDAGLAGGPVQQPLGDQHVQEQPDAVAAHLGVRPVGVAVVHEPLAAVAGPRRAPRGVGHVHAADDAQDAVAPQPGPPVAEPADQRGVQPVLRPDACRRGRAGRRSRSPCRARGAPGERLRSHRSIVRAVITRRDGVDEVGPRRVEPGDRRVAAEPRPLAAHEPPGRARPCAPAPPPA